MCSVVGSYGRMALKVANYNSLEQEAQVLRERYDNLQRKVKQTNEQLATLQSLADEVTTAYGVKKQPRRVVGSGGGSARWCPPWATRSPNTVICAPRI